MARSRKAVPGKQSKRGVQRAIFLVHKVSVPYCLIFSQIR